MVNGRLMPAGPAKMPYSGPGKGAFGRKSPRVQPRTAAIPVMVNRHYRVQRQVPRNFGGSFGSPLTQRPAVEAYICRGQAMAVYGDTNRDLHIHRNDRMHSMRDPGRAPSG